MTEPVDGDQFLVGDPRSLGIVTEPLKAGAAPRIVQFADKHVELNYLRVPLCQPTTPSKFSFLMRTKTKT